MEITNAERWLMLILNMPVSVDWWLVLEDGQFGEDQCREVVSSWRMQRDGQC